MITHKAGGRWTADEMEEAKEALRRSVSARAAARLLGVEPASLLRAFTRKGLRTGDFVGQSTVPDGQRVKGNSTFETLPDGTKRWIKTEQEPDEPSAFEPVPPGFAVSVVSSYLDGKGQVRGQHVRSEQGIVDRFEAFKRAAAEVAETYRGLADPVSSPVCELDEDLKVFFPLGDPHLGLLAHAAEVGEHHDLRIAERDLTNAVTMLVAAAPAADEAVLVNLGDLTHSRNDSQLTAHGGNKLDVDGRWFKVLQSALFTMRRLIDALLAKYKRVRVVNVAGNHDPEVAMMVALWLLAVYEREPRVTVEPATNPFYYLEFGKVLVQISHTDGAKPKDLAAIAAEYMDGKPWGRATYRYGYGGHVHHETKLEVPGFVFESFRTLAGRDFWHHWKGYRAGRSLTSITMHREWGEIGRASVDLRMVRAAFGGS
jgi:hypothetical protein